MKASLQLRLSQHLALTPQLQQSIRLLQLSTLELQQEVAMAISQNPLLENEDDWIASPLRVAADGSVIAQTPGSQPVESMSSNVSSSTSSTERLPPGLRTASFSGSRPSSNPGAVITTRSCVLPADSLVKKLASPLDSAGTLSISVQAPLVSLSRTKVAPVRSDPVEKPTLVR